MTDPRTSDDSALPAEPRLPEEPPEPAPSAEQDEQITSFAAEPPAERAAGASDTVAPPAEAPAPAPEPVQPEQTATLADEEPVHPDATAAEPTAAEPAADASQAPERAEPPTVEPPTVVPPTVVPPTTEPPTTEPPTTEPPTTEPPTTEPPTEPPTVEPPTTAAAPVLAAPVPAADDADAAGDEDTAGPARAPRAWLPLAAVGAAVALLTAGAGYLTWELRQESRTEQAREEATSAARDAARLLFSYDHSTLEQDFEKGLSVTTGEFREQYERTTKEVVTPVAEQYDAVVVAEVIEAAIVQASADEVTALVFLNQGTTSTRVQGQKVDQSRVRMQLVREDGRWLVAAVSAL